MKKAFVTGGTGFLGLNLIEDLVKDGWEVHALHREKSNLKYLNKFDVKKVKGSINDIDSLLAGLPDSPDAVFHVAGNTSLWKENDLQQYRDNVIGTKNMVNCALQKKAAKFIHTSTGAAFGIHEDVINEQTQSNAENCGVNYYLTKYLAEKEVEKGVQQGLDAVILNPIHIVGKYDSHNWAQLIQAVYQDDLPGVPPGIGMFCHAKDVSAAHIKAIENGKKGERYLLGGETASFLEFINEIQRQTGKKLTKKANPKWTLQLGAMLFGLGAAFTKKEPQLTPEKIKMVCEKMICDFSKAQKELGLGQTPISKMISDSHQWLQEENLL